MAATNLSEGLLAKMEEGVEGVVEGVKAEVAQAETALSKELEGGDASQKAGVRDLLNLDGDSQRAAGKGGYEYMLAIRLPKTAKKKKKEQEAFEKFKTDPKHNNKTVQEMLNKLMVASNEKVASIRQDGETSHSIDCDETLEGTLNCVIGMLLSLFQSLSDSHEAPIEILKFTSVEINKVFICTRMSPKLAETLADMAEYSVQLSVKGVQDLGIVISDTSNLVPAFVKYDKEQKEKGQLVTFDRADKPKEVTILNHIDRIRLFYDKLTDHLNVWDLVQMLQPLNVTMKMFPIHDEEELQKLQKSWSTWRLFFTWRQPIDDVRNYYGEEIAFYFLFTETMRKGMLILLFITLMFWQHWTDWALAYSIVIVAWFAGLHKFWKRLEAYKANAWGSDYTHTSAAVKDLINPDFVGQDLPSDFDEAQFEKKADPTKQLIGQIISCVVGTFFILLVTCGVVLNRWAISQGWITRATGNLLVSVQIRLFSMTWDQIVPRLTAGEHHVTMRALGQSNALKNFVFLFFNTFNAFLWIAYVSPSYDPEQCLAPGLENGCRSILHNSLVQAFPVLVIFAGLGLLVPLINILKKFRKQAKDMEELKKKGEADDFYAISSMEMQTKMLDFTDADVADDFMQVMSSLAFVGMWVVAAPVTTCILAYVALSVQHGVDAYRMTKLYQRPFPTRVASIGIWNGVMTFLKYSSIINLSGLLVTNPRVDMPGMLGLLPKVCHEFAYSRHANSSVLLADVADGTLPPECTMTTEANLLVFFILLVFFMGGVALFDACVSDVGPITALNYKRQLHQRAKLFEFDLQDFNEVVVLTGHSKWEDSKYHAKEVTPQLKPDDPLYVECVTVGA